MSLIAVPGASDANSYVTVAQATLFLDERLNNEPWYATPTSVTLQAQREAALITATRLIDQMVVWIGQPATTTQALAWPRTGPGLDPLVLPVPIQRATAYYALALLRDTSEQTTTTTSTIATGTVKRRRLGETEVEYFQPGTTTSTTAAATAVLPQTQVPTEIRQMLRPYGRIGGGVNIPLLRT